MVITRRVYMKCLICESSGKQVEYEKACSLGTHLWKTHGLKPQEYYDKYIAKPGDGKCAECGKPTKFRTIGQGYLEFCSKKCSAKHIAADPERNEHKSSAYKESMLKQYGVENCAQIEDAKRKRKETMKERYGVEYYSQVNDFAQIAAAGNMAHHGVRSYMLLPEMQQKIRDANMKKYGVPYMFCQNTEYAKVKYKEYLEAHGCELVEFKDKKHITYRCKKCGHVTTEQDLFLKVREGFGLDFCTRCFPKSSPVSGEEQQVKAFIEGLGFKVEHHDRGFLEQYGADMVIEEKKLIVEFDGIRWHNEMYRPDEYHVTKTNIAERMGYHLIHLFSDEWEEKRPIVESRLKNALGIMGLPVAARDCRVEPVSAEVAGQFNESFHIQGDTVSSVRYGLYGGDTLYAVMTFGKSRFMDDTWEMIRYCVRPGYHVRGGAGKLFSRFIADEHPDKVLTYADRRWSGSGAFYGRIGFRLDGVTEPGYSYVVGNHRESRFNYQKYKLTGPDVTPGATEHEIMYGRGIYRIYDCGNYRYIWEPNVK